MSIVYLILGGNRGNRTEIISTAIVLLSSRIGPVQTKSRLYESESWGFNSENFINQVVVLKTTLSPAHILEISLEIETQLGRTRSGNGYEARTLDIDLLYYDALVINSDFLTIPHPRIGNRRFVLMPLTEVAPDLVDPATGISVKEMVESCPDAGKVWYYDKI